MSMQGSTRRDFLKMIGLGATSLALPRWLHAEKPTKDRPNILFCISDDQSWLHTSVSGTKAVKTPSFGRIAEEGIRFTNAYCAAPSCTPSRSGILTGQEIWRLEQGGMLFGALPRKFEVYPLMLEQAGYAIGWTGKGWAPGNLKAGGWERNPVGKEYNSIHSESHPGTSNIDYAANFRAFLKDRQTGKPFCFWYGSYEPHRGYKKGAGIASGKRIEEVEVPAFLPDTPEVRNDLLDYLTEIEWHDRQLGRMIEMLEKTSELDNTMIVVTSDNGMPFPRAKATLYDYGVHIPLAVRWGGQSKGGRVVDDFVSLTDMAPTFLEMAGFDVPGKMMGHSFKDILLSDKSGRIDPTRDHAITARERHTVCRKGDLGYPARAIRTDDFLYIHNYEPDRWPAGDPELKSAHGYVYGDTDPSPTKRYLLEHKEDEDTAALFQLAFGKRPHEELYDVKNDPGQIRNLADSSDFAKTRKKLRHQLDEYLRETGDPRSEGKSPWDAYPYYCGNPDGIVPYSEYVKTRRKQK